ncbi:peptidase family M1 [Oesophagostomum dentatum]|uniref:Peptidase family M1 n=1 Tax=Oesophagostomum dentatum TaxID=61180 RepID=A0A0B1TE52_OESDE|nr:peptidase family M1 [Oesophagostomum dentatum]
MVGVHRDSSASPISYTGRIREGHFGLYQNIYRDKERKRKIAAVTQMEPYHARKMVPCFDEPEYKASWTVTVVHPNGTTAITNAKEIRVWSAPDGKKLRRHALWAAKSALHHFEEYFGINEVMPKQDLVALENFAAGAMENWGLITFRKNVLLGSYHMTYAEAMESETVVAHELTHQLQK